MDTSKGPLARPMASAPMARTPVAASAAVTRPGSARAATATRSSVAFGRGPPVKPSIRRLQGESRAPASLKTTTTTTAAAARIVKSGGTARSSSAAQLDGAAAAMTRPPRPAASKDATSKERRRAEVYAVNAYLKKLEQANYQKFLDDVTSSVGLDDLSTLSWGSSQSSNMPSPTYRTAKEKQRDLIKEGKAGPRAFRKGKGTLPGPLPVPKRTVGSFGGV